MNFFLNVGTFKQDAYSIITTKTLNNSLHNSSYSDTILDESNVLTCPKCFELNTISKELNISCSNKSIQ